MTDKLSTQHQTTFDSIRQFDAGVANHGYKGLYGGLGAKDIQARKGLKKS